MRREKRIRQKHRRIRRGIYILPNLFTTGSLFCGFYAILSVMKGDFYRAAVAIMISFMLDGFDGRIARATGTSTRFGIEYDSLADLVAFGVAPGVLIFSWGLFPFGRVGWLAAFLFAACGSLRLARFNVQIEQMDKGHFKGLPIPAAALMLASTVVLFESLNIYDIKAPIAVLVMVFVLSFLMVSNIPYDSFKEFHLMRRKPFHVLVTSVLLLIVIVAYPQIIIFSLAVIYAFSGPVHALLHLSRKRKVSSLVEEKET